MKLMGLLKKVLLIFLMVGCLLLPLSTWSFDRDIAGISENFSEFFDSDTGYAKEYVDLSTSVVKITSIGSIVTHYPVWDDVTRTYTLKEATAMFEMSGSGFLVAGGYVITAAHMVQPNGGVVQDTKNSYFVGYGPTVKILNRLVIISDGTTATVIYVDTAKDIAVLKLDGNWPAVEPLKYPMAYTYSNRTTSPLQAGDAVAVLVRVRNEDMSQGCWYEVRYGTVKAPYVVIPEGNPIESMPWFDPNDITLNIAIYPGDSGSPVFAFVDGKPVLIGIARALSWNPYTGEVLAYAARIDEVKQIVEGMLK